MDSRKDIKVKLPDDISHEYPPHVLEWVFKYGITVEELIHHGVTYSKHYNQLIFSWHDEAGNLLCWQGRNFSLNSTKKYFTQGAVKETITSFGPIEGPRVVLVEDCISAIKIARQCPSMACLSSGVPFSKLKRATRLFGAFLVWLDGNMYPNAQKMATQLQLLGVEAHAVYSPMDPKEYTDEDIKKVLEGQMALDKP